jgi:protein O-GlcNAc transferase
MNEALLAQAVRSHQAGNLGEAARLYSAVLQTTPRNFQALYLLGFIHFQIGQYTDAVRLIGEAVKINPQSADGFYNLGCSLQALQRHEEAVTAFDRAIALKPDYSEALINRGATLLSLRRQTEAVASFDAALRYNPRDAEAISNRATALFESKRYDEAAAGFATLLAVAPQFPYALGNLALARAYCCDWRFLEKDRAEITSGIRAGQSVISPHASTLLLDDAEDQLRCARQWVKDRCPASSAPLWRGERYTNHRIRVAYLSADFQAHATAFLIAGVFEHHNRARFETVLVSFGPDEDRSPMRARLMRACDRFIAAEKRSDAEIAGLLRRMEIDIAVDLKGFTQGNRPGIFAQRPAPVQVNYLAHPGTMGADYMDYILADETVIPPGQEQYYCEKVVRLPDSYQSNDDKRAIAERMLSRAEVGLPRSGFVFCCFNNSYKITPAVFDVWLRLLKAVPGSVLWLLDDNPVATANLKRESEARGVAPGRLIFAPRVDTEDHLARQALADLFLDTSPCTAHTTASDALWRGLPVLTVLGNTFAGRVAASLLRAAGLPDLIAPSLDAYEDRALRLASEPASLTAMRQILTRDQASRPLFDTARFTRGLEAAFTTMRERTQEGLPPVAFSVPDEGKR